MYDTYHMIDALVALMTPPPHPNETGNESEWIAIEQQLRIQFPKDYKNLVNTYGSGKIADFIIVLNPFSKNKYINLLEQINANQPSTTLGAIKYLKDNSGEKEFPYPIYPEKTGLIPWAKTDNGNIFFIKTDKDPDSTTIIVYDGSEPLFEEYHVSITDFLIQVLTDKIQSKIFSLEPNEKTHFHFTQI